MSEKVDNLVGILDAESNLMEDLAWFEIINYLRESHGANMEEAEKAVERWSGECIPEFSI